MTQTDPPRDDDALAGDGETTDAPRDEEQQALIEETFSAYIDGELEDTERARFEAELAEDDALRAEFEEFRETIQALRSIHAVPDAEPPQLDPDAFTRKLEGTIRSRSRGRFFHDDFFYRSRVPYEVFAVIMLGVIAAMLYILSPDAPDHDPSKATPVQDAMGGSPEERRAPPKDIPSGERPDDARDDKQDTQDDAPTRADARDAGEADPAEADAGDSMAEVDAATEEPADPTDKAGTDSTNRLPAEVKQMRVEMMVYTISLRDANPTRRAQSLARQIRSTSRKFKVSQKALRNGGQKLTVKMEKRQLASFLQTFSKLGRARGMRTYVESTDVTPKATVTFRIESASRRDYIPPKIP